MMFHAAASALRFQGLLYNRDTGKLLISPVAFTDPETGVSVQSHEAKALASNQVVCHINDQNNGAQGTHLTIKGFSAP